ncbi:MAG: phosphoribosylanthranilate isomerase [Pirellulaceae bacterium]|nr:phosphoribosylanthranilate isomerase [Pirellulaceae bacterium]
MLFRVKICGVTTPQDARLVADCGADAIGLNFYAGSPRFVTRSQARELLGEVPPSVARVGVFVNAAVEEILECQQDLGLDYLQLHGDEPVEYLARLAPSRVVRALRCRPGDSTMVDRLLADCGTLGHWPAALLIDAHRPGTYGGTGRTVDWPAVAELGERCQGIRLVLAGGLNPGNVRQAIQAARPAAVDTASGVELAPGRKSPDLVRQFVREALAALTSLDRRPDR